MNSFLTNKNNVNFHIFALESSHLSTYVSGNSKGVSSVGFGFLRPGVSSALPFYCHEVLRSCSFFLCDRIIVHISKYCVTLGDNLGV